MKLDNHRAGFVTIAGAPNAGKSTLVNALLGRMLTIATEKPQTTRKLIRGIDNGPQHQIVYIDMPGHLDPHYALQRAMMQNVHHALQESDLVLWLVDGQKRSVDPFLMAERKRQKGPFWLLINKIDAFDEKKIREKVAYFKEKIAPTGILPISALHGTHLNVVKKMIHSYLPLHPPYYPKDATSDQSLPFLTGEIIRKAILTHYREEVPYSVEVKIDALEDRVGMMAIKSTIYVAKAGQKAILIGHNGEALKKMGRSARIELEAFFKKKVLLSQYVRVAKNWRENTKRLMEWGYSVKT